MEAACDVGVVDERDEFIVRAAPEVPVALAQVNIDLDGMLGVLGFVERAYTTDWVGRG